MSVPRRTEDAIAFGDMIMAQDVTNDALKGLASGVGAVELHQPRGRKQQRRRRLSAFRQRLGILMGPYLVVYV